MKSFKKKKKRHLLTAQDKKKFSNKNNALESTVVNIIRSPTVHRPHKH